MLAIGGDEFKVTLKEMLTNPVYQETARRRSHLFRDQKETPMERALWWIDYVLRNPNITHLKNSKLDGMNFIVKHSIDVIGVLMVLVVLLVIVSLKCIKIVLGRRGQLKVKVH